MFIQMINNDLSNSHVVYYFVETRLSFLGFFYVTEKVDERFGR